VVFNGLEISEGNGFVTIRGVRDFHLVHTFECGQCFRWYREDDGSYTGVAGGKVANISYNNDILKISNTSLDEFKNFWFTYLDLGRDYSEIKKAITRDEIMEKAVSFGYGIRLLRQDLWETLISFIISANNRIPRIMKIIAAISGSYGKDIYWGDRRFKSFPGADELASADLEQLKTCKGGFRCRYIHETANMVCSGRADLSLLYNTDLKTDDIRRILMQFPGVGNKVADCTILYSGLRYDVFPTDVWVKRVMEELYFGREVTIGEIREFAAEYFGPYAGFAQQYLFYYARENRIGTGYA